MPSNLFTQQYVSDTAPKGAVLGDEWLNSTTGKLYKQTLVSGVVSWADISPLPAAGTVGNVLTSNGAAWISGLAPISLPTQTSNSGKYLTTDGTTSSWGTVASGLVVTANKIANYTAAVNDLVRANTLAGAFSVTLPVSPIDGAVVGIIDISNNFNTYNLTILPGAGATVESDTSVILDVNHTYAEFVYSLSNTNWVWKGTPNAANSLTSGKAMVLSMIFG